MFFFAGGDWNNSVAHDPAHIMPVWIRRSKILPSIPGRERGHRLACQPHPRLSGDAFSGST
jgi:hypothetical protein